MLVSPLLAVLAATATSAQAAPAPAATTCSTSTTGGTVTRTLWMGFSQGFRSYNLRVPAGITSGTPVLLSLHGLGSNAFFQEVTSGWDGYADANKFIVAYPAGSAWGQAWDINTNSGDVAFVKAVAHQIATKYCVDSKRIFLEGGSLGGLMTQRLLCDAESTFAAGISTISGPPDLLGFGCSLSRGVAVGVVSSESDPLFGPATSRAARDAWLELDNCSATGVSVPNPYGNNGAIYGGCDDGVEVMWRTYSTSSGHAYPTGASLADFHDHAWSFLSAHPLA